MEIPDNRRHIKLIAAYHINVALYDWMKDFDHFNIQAGEQFHFRDNGNAEAVGYKTGRDLVLYNLISDMRAFSQCLEHFINFIANAGCFGEINIRIWQGLLQVYGVKSCQFVILGYDPDVRFGMSIRSLFVGVNRRSGHNDGHLSHLPDSGSRQSERKNEYRGQDVA